METGAAGAETTWLRQAGLRGEPRGKRRRAVFRSPIPAPKTRRRVPWAGGVTGFQIIY